MEKNSRLQSNNLQNVSGADDALLFDAYKDVFDYMTCGAMIFSPDGLLLKANKIAFEIFNVEATEFTDSSKINFSDYRVLNMDGQELPAQKWPINRVLNKEHINDARHIIIRNEIDKPCYVTITGIPHFSADGSLKHCVLLIHDISGQVETGNKLDKELKKTLEKSNKLEDYQKRLHTERQLLQSIIDNIPVMVSMYDEKLDTIQMNNAFTVITGWTQDDIAKTHVMDLVYPDYAYRMEVEAYMKTLKKGFKDITMHTKDGCVIESSWANVRLPDGRIAGVGIDMSGRKEMENELIEAREKAERENRVQSAFIQNISHEVRTPMNSILGFAELLYKEVQREKAKEFLDSISYNGTQLLRLIDDIVDFSRLDKNEMSLSKEEISVNYLMEQTQKQFAGLKKNYNKKHLSVKLKLPPETHDDIMLYTDIYRLQQVLINLISNALKYTEKGKIEIGFDFSDDGQNLLFFVQDTGMGIKKEFHERVFQRFNRFHETHKAQFRGTGLGLAICKHLVQLLDGQIWFESEPGKGSVFYFTHPYTKQKSNARLLDEKSRDEENYSLPDLPDTTLLIAEDDHYSFMLMEQMLQDTKAKVLHADTGKKAAELAEKNDVDLIFLDIRLPEMDGYQVIKQIRKRTPNIPVIAQTANALPEDKEKSRHAGFTYHAVKPLSKDELYSILNRFL